MKKRVVRNGPSGSISSPFQSVGKLIQKKKSENSQQKRIEEGLYRNLEISADFLKTTNAGKELTQQIVRIYNLRELYGNLVKVHQLTLKTS